MRGKMQIKVDLKIFLFLLIFIITHQIKIYMLLMVFALIHEFGHLVMGLILGLKVESISIIPIGFTIKFKLETDSYNIKIKNANLLAIKKLIIALSGPIVNILVIFIILIYHFVTKNIMILNIPLELIIYSNLLIFIFNMIPVYPLDGGRVIEQVTYIFFGLKNSYIITNKITNVTTIILTIIASIYVLIYKNIAIVIIIIYLWILTINENKRFKIKQKIIKGFERSKNL